MSSQVGSFADFYAFRIAATRVAASIDGLKLLQTRWPRRVFSWLPAADGRFGTAGRLTGSSLSADRPTVHCSSHVDRASRS